MSDTWLWVIAALILFPLAGLLLMLALGASVAPADAVRRLWQRATMRRPVHRGVALPDEVPEEQPPPEDSPDRPGG
ncbi:MAG TPA: hypothetical protein VK896_04605 [Gaiellaceae bacterium]|nr:hypothetical protein [Gaiellaceae bacterium]HSJ93297.1 hypothetical protein [Gaiellaceae bacterium]